MVVSEPVKGVWSQRARLITSSSLPYLPRAALPPQRAPSSSIHDHSLGPRAPVRGGFSRRGGRLRGIRALSFLDPAMTSLRRGWSFSRHPQLTLVENDPMEDVAGDPRIMRRTLLFYDFGTRNFSVGPRDQNRSNLELLEHIQPPLNHPDSSR